GRIGVGEVRIAPLVELDLLRVGQEAFGQGRGLLARQIRRPGPDRLENSVEAPERRRIDAEMNVRRAAPLPDGEIFVDVPEVTFPIRTGRFRGVCVHGTRKRSSRRPSVCNLEQVSCSRHWRWNPTKRSLRSELLRSIHL